MDNLYVKGSNQPIHHTDEQANTFQLRSLADGSQYLVLKNFPPPAFLKEKLESRGTDFQYQALDYFWLAGYKKPEI